MTSAPRPPETTETVPAGQAADQPVIADQPETAGPEASDRPDTAGGSATADHLEIAGQPDRTAGTDEPRAGDEGDEPAARRPGRLARVGSAFWRWLDSPASVDTAICLVFATFAMWLTSGLWPDPNTRAIAANPQDQALIEWFLAHGSLFWSGDLDLVTQRLNAPIGVNLMSNASHILHGILLAPVTLLFGAAASFAVLVALNMAATAAGWYLLLARGLGLHRWAAAVAAAFAGFAPGMVSQSLSHLHISAQWLVPPIVYLVIRLTRRQQPLGVIVTGVGLGLLIAAQLFLGEEVLYLTVLTFALFAIGYALRRPRWTRAILPRFLGGMAIAGAVGYLLVAHALWVQFEGDLHTPNAPFGAEFFYADLASFTLYSPLSLAGGEEAGKLATSPSEYNTFLSLALLLVAAAIALWRWRQPAVPALALAFLVIGWLSLGPNVTLEGEKISFPPSLYSLIADVPVIDGALPTRYALALIPLLAILLAYGLDRATRSTSWLRVAVPLAVVLALIPVAPKQIETEARAAVPQFISTGAWRECTRDGGTLVPVPLPVPEQPDLMRWPATANARFAIPQGFFIGPWGPDGMSSIGIWPRDTSALLAEVNRTGVPATVTPEIKDKARQDVEYWKADCLALARGPAQDALRITLERLFGPGRYVSDTWVWDHYMLRRPS